MTPTIKFLKKGIRYNGQYIPVWFSMGSLRNYPEKTITIYAKEHGKKLPKELNPENDTDTMTDYFETDRAYITPSSKFYTEAKNNLL